MPETPDSPEAFGPHKRKLSEKATTNGDPNVERKQKRLEQVQNMRAAPAPTKKTIQAPVKSMAPAKTMASAKSMAPAKMMASAKTTASAKTKAPAKTMAPAEVEPVEEISDNSETEEDIELPVSAPEPIMVDDDDGDVMPVDNAEENPEEDDEAELRKWPNRVQKMV